MKIAIVFDSITQNTKTVAEAICQALPQTDVVYCGAPASGIDADCYLVGSWTDKGMCSDKIKSFLEHSTTKPSPISPRRDLEARLPITKNSLNAYRPSFPRTTCSHRPFSVRAKCP